MQLTFLEVCLSSLMYKSLCKQLDSWVEMDLETENRIAAILMKEAAELRRKADMEGVHAYLQKPNVRGRPNSRFLTATVLGVQQGKSCAFFLKFLHFCLFYSELEFFLSKIG